MKRWLVGILATMVVLTAGCSSVAPRQDSFIYDPDVLPPAGHCDQDTWGIMLPVVEVGDYFPGAECEWPFVIVNGQEPRVYEISYSVPSEQQLVLGYSRAPDMAREWVVITEPSVSLAACEVRKVTIRLHMPIDAVIDDKWQFNIAVYPSVATSLFETGYAAKILISMEG